MEEPGSPSFTQRQSNLFGEGFSFSGFERNKLYLNLGSKRFLDISGISGVDAIEDGRSAVFADFDNDGDLDIFLTNFQGRAQLLFRNEVGQDNSFIRITLEGTKSGHDAFGAVVRLKSSQGTLTKVKAGGSGYLSQSDPRLLFGLGSDSKAEWIEVKWPSGTLTRLENVPANSSLRIVEGKGAPLQQEEKHFSLPDPVTLEQIQLQSLGVKTGEPFPDLSLSTLGGESTSLVQILRPDRRYIINFWATWCVPCAKEMPELQELASEYGSKKVEVIGISLDDAATHELIEGFLKQHGIRYTVYLAGEGVVNRIFGTGEAFIPLSFILDGAGKVEGIFPGWSSQARNRLLELLR